MADKAIDIDEIAKNLFDCGVVKFGDFLLKSGIMSPIYIDLRVIISQPWLLQKLCNLIWKQVASSCEGRIDRLCGVPYTALPLASLLSIEHQIPMVVKRKEAKDYGTKKILEGHFKTGDRCLIIEDVVTSGSSVLETAKCLREHGLVVDDVCVLIDRCQGGRATLEANGVHMMSVLSVLELVHALHRQGLVDETGVGRISSFIEGNRFECAPLIDANAALDAAAHPAVGRLRQLITAKASNICVAADLVHPAAILRLADQLGPLICALKIHIDIIEFDSIACIRDFTTQLRALSTKHNFLLFEDRKLADIGFTMQKQLYGGVYRIGQWADVVTAHAVAGASSVEALGKGGDEEGEAQRPAVLLLAEMSSDGTLLDSEYGQKVLQMLVTHPAAAACVAGLVCQRPDAFLSARLRRRFLCFTPGVSLDAAPAGDGLGQAYRDVADVINAGTDVIIVGRSLLKIADQHIMLAKLDQLRHTAFAAWQLLQ